MSLRELGELGVLRLMLPYLDRAGGDLVIGAGEDDAAAWREPDGSFTVATCDTAVEGRHFELGRQAPFEVGWRALALALGDLAAKGARPTYGLVSVSLSPIWDAERVEDLYRGFSELARETGLKLVGGDTTAAEETSISIAVLGRTARSPIPRAAARPGWTVGVTGRLGAPEWSRPRPRFEEGERLATAGLCCGDISDGLLREMDKFLAASGAGCRLELASIPCAPGVSALQALASGEEVELVCCGPAAAIEAVADILTPVGTLLDESQVVVVDSAGNEVEVGERGYDHFA